MKKWGILLLLLLFLAGCAPSGSYETISPEEAMDLMQTEASYVLLDVRTQEEFDQSHIPGAVLLPHDQVSDQAERYLPEKKRLILVYCRSGRRSKEAAEALAGLGYTNVRDFGGILDWPYEVEQGEASPTCEDGKHQWMEDCTSRICAVCGLTERVAQ